MGKGDTKGKLSVASPPTLPPGLPGSTPTERAQALLAWLAAEAAAGRPTVVTYKCAYALVVRRPFATFGQRLAGDVLDVAVGTTPVEVPGLGAVRLDAFIVAQSTGRPSDGHWVSAAYGKAEWLRWLGAATVLSETAGGSGRRSKDGPERHTLPPGA